MHTLPNISRGKGNQTRKLVHLIEVQQDKYFPSKIMQKNEAGRLVPDFFLFF